MDKSLRRFIAFGDKPAGYHQRALIIQLAIDIKAALLRNQAALDGIASASLDHLILSASSTRHGRDANDEPIVDEQDMALLSSARSDLTLAFTDCSDAIRAIEQFIEVLSQVNRELEGGSDGKQP